MALWRLGAGALGLCVIAAYGVRMRLKDARQRRRERFMKEALALERCSAPSWLDGGAGCVLVSGAGCHVLATGHSGEIAPTAHAVSVLVAKLEAAQLPVDGGCELYLTSAPCTVGPRSCAALLRDCGVRRVVLARATPGARAPKSEDWRQQGVAALRAAGIAVEDMEWPNRPAAEGGAGRHARQL